MISIRLCSEPSVKVPHEKGLGDAIRAQCRGKSWAEPPEAAGWVGMWGTVPLLPVCPGGAREQHPKWVAAARFLFPVVVGTLSP